MAKTFLSRSKRVPPGTYLIAIAVASVGVVCAAQPAPNGEEIYLASCLHCHGADGQGTEAYAARLEGDLSVSQLADVIGQTMPEDDPGSLSEDEAEAVAAYVHETFYSAIARARTQPARVELSRLTVTQYRQAIADLIGSFGELAEWGDQRGLQGEYYNSRQPRGRRAVAATRVDSQIDFDFGTEAPLPELEDPGVFSIRWSGSVLASETGQYEFIIRTEHAARLWINNTKVPLIDAWVVSGEETEHKASQYLIAGGVYSLRLEFTKAKQGVDDSASQKEKPPSAEASVALLWRRPHSAPEPIPSRQLSPDSAPEAFICAAPFPPDDRSYGWERGTAVSQAWDEATTAAAIEAVGYIADRLDALAGTSEDASDREEKLRAFSAAFAERAFRRPLKEELMQRYVDRQFEAAGEAERAVRRVVLLVLKSPRFLFREIDGGPDAYDVAARLSFGLWNSIPDEELLDAARAGRLTTEEQVREQAERMLGDRRAQTKFQDFLLTWLHVDPEVDLSKDPETYPGFDAASIADLRTSLELFLEEIVWSEGSDFRELLLAEEVYLNERLAKFYEAERRLPNGFEKVRLDDGQRAGILTHPYVMARFSYRSETSPIHRGVFLARGMLGQLLRPPPEAFTPLPPELHPDLTTRERVALQTAPAQCMSCHAIINPLGFTLERFDAAGRFRDLERGQPVNDAAVYETGTGATARLRGARELAEYLAASEEGHAAFVEQLFHHLVQQPVRAYGPKTLEELQQSFADHDFHIRKLAVEIMVASTLVGRGEANQEALAETAP